MKTNSQRGVALILTLILLAVITFLTVAFLALSRRERAVVTVVLDQTRASQAAETATERAKAQLIAQILATTNKWSYGLTVSTNFISSGGFQNSGPAYNSLLNVNYQYPDGTPLNPADLKQNIANLYYDPRPPVVIPITNSINQSLPTRIADFRYYLDFNRNQRFDTNGMQPVIGPLAATPFLHTDGTWIATPLPGVTVSNRYVGDPEWIGMLDKLGQRHDAKNRFIARYAFLTLPAGKTLDFNAAHNQAKNALVPGLGTTNEGFLRNQGFGSWEINLAAALTDLNTNSYSFWNVEALSYDFAGWGTNYLYSTSTNPGGYYAYSSTGPSFEDALGLLRYRYNGSYTNLLSARDYFRSAADPYGDRANSFTNDLVDEYANGPLVSGSVVTNDSHNDPSLPWSGADNPNAIFTPQDLFDLAKVPRHLVKSLLNLGTTNASLSSHDRYTYYRLLSVLGTDSGVEPPDLNIGLPSDQAPPKVNLNFDNRPGVPPLTEWVPEVFFTNAAERLLRDSALHPYGFARLSITNIPVWPLYTNYYTPAVHRLLQVAANLYDATTTNRWPSVFRPIFRSDGVNIFIVNYHELPNADLLAPGVGTIVDPSDPAQFARIPRLGTAEQSLTAEPMLSGVPLIIGAKKGLPNFNEFSVQSVVLLSRKLQFTKDNTGKIFKTNQMYFIGISNMCGVEAWNSYTSTTNTYPNGLRMSVSVDLTTLLSNQTSVVVSNRAFHSRSYPPLVAVGWPTPTPFDYINHRYQASAPDRTGFFMPLRTNTLFIPNCQYWVGTNGTGSLHDENAAWPVGPTGFPIPKLTLQMMARVRFSLVDTNLNRIIDYVNLETLTNQLDLTAEMIGNSDQDALANVWQTNRPSGSTDENVPTMGIINQIRISQGRQTTTTKQWNDYNSSASVSVQDKAKGIDAFREFMGLSALTYSNQAPASPTMNTPFNPVRKLSIETTWQVNDPLVHYTAGDLGKTNLLSIVDPPNSTNYSILKNLGFLNTRTQPWGGHPDVSVPDPRSQNILQPQQDPNAYNLALKDPQIRLSDDWEFPTNKFGNLGLIGRVHRGTPWQTIYLKAPDVAPGLVNPVWQNWCGNWDARDAVGNRPVSDRFLFEHFTVAITPSATRGQLSINNDELAAWSAVISGVQDLHSAVADSDFEDQGLLSRLASTAIQPAGGAGWNSPLGIVVDAINRTRTNQALFPAQTFTNLGNLLIVPELTTSSPFLTPALTTTISDIQRQRGLTDAAYERIPQQIMSLLRGDDDPRFVVYAYGQSLMPAPGSIVTDDPYLQLCTNYAITAESAVRTVVRIVGAPKPGDANTNVQPKAVIESFNFLPPD